MRLTIRVCHVAWPNVFFASSCFVNSYLQLKSASIRHQRKEASCEEASFNITS